MASTLSSFTFLPMVVVLSVFICPALSDTEALINQVCSQAQDFRICHHFFRTRVTSPTIDITGLCHIALDESLSLMENTHTFVQRLKAHEHNRNVQNLYSICETAYGILIDEFVNANSALGGGDYRSMVFYVGRCDRFVNDCERVIGSQVALLSKRNMKARELISISLAVGGILNVGR